MQAATHPNAEKLAHLEKKDPPATQFSAETRFPPLKIVSRPTVDTAAAAFYLNRQPQTLRIWACLENGPLRPLRINGRLAWPVPELKRVLAVA
jgi:hypothetical protein